MGERGKKEERDGKMNRKIIFPLIHLVIRFFKMKCIISAAFLPFLFYLIGRKYNSVLSTQSTLYFCGIFYISLNLISSHIDRQMMKKQTLYRFFVHFHVAMVE